MRKSGTEMINHNLETLAHLPNAGISAAYQQTEASNGAKTPEELKHLTKRLSIFPTRKTEKIFTFIREPIERFISGVNEIYYRKYLPINNPINKKSSLNKQIIESNILSINSTKIMLDSILTGNLVALSQFVSVSAISHIYPMTNNLGPWHLDYIGRIENISTQWKSVEDLYGIKLPLDKKFNKHRSSLDEFKVKSSLRRFLKDNNAYLRVLCSLFQRDYDCFQIPFPVGCL